MFAYTHQNDKTLALAKVQAGDRRCLELARFNHASDVADRIRVAVLLGRFVRIGDFRLCVMKQAQRTPAKGQHAPIQIPGQRPGWARNSLMRCSMPPSNERVVAVVLGPIQPSVQDAAKVPMPTSSGRLFVPFCRRRLAVFHALTIAVYSTASSGYCAQEGRGATSPKATGPYAICSRTREPRGPGQQARPEPCCETSNSQPVFGPS